jgi:putative ABC transport system substrate-binding protein
VAVHSPEELEGAFATMTRERAEALIVFPSTMLFAERKQLVSLAAKHRLAAIYNAREFVDLGGLMAYGAVLSDLQRRAATYVDKILKGARPGELPVEQPMTFDLAVNLKTAKTLGLTLPPEIMVQATRVIQ